MIEIILFQNEVDLIAAAIELHETHNTRFDKIWQQKELFEGVFLEIGVLIQQEAVFKAALLQCFRNPDIVGLTKSVVLRQSGAFDVVGQDEVPGVVRGTVVYDKNVPSIRN